MQVKKVSKVVLLLHVELKQCNELPNFQNILRKKCRMLLLNWQAIHNSFNVVFSRLPDFVKHFQTKYPSMLFLFCV